ncbi:hypothetical protein NM208_g14995 [Fusarium decemcellulare]|uniref:Uncharacterized protein n=1 Tax=Fusarium decemcellulare TaxID=57161 RepID=A0ACC1RET4_9HYPO|nr:hypothetical protein NM208_g14995 [Fusarium decemcellulare]
MRDSNCASILVMYRRVEAITFTLMLVCPKPPTHMARGNSSGLAPSPTQKSLNLRCGLGRTDCGRRNDTDTGTPSGVKTGKTENGDGLLDDLPYAALAARAMAFSFTDGTCRFHCRRQTADTVTRGKPYFRIWAETPERPSTTTAPTTTP